MPQFNELLTELYDTIIQELKKALRAYPNEKFEGKKP